MHIWNYQTIPTKNNDPKPFFQESAKIIEDLFFFTEKSEICIFCII